MLKNIFNKSKIILTDPVLPEKDGVSGVIGKNIDLNIREIKELFGDSFDLIIKFTDVNGIKTVFIALDGMYNNLLVSEAVIEPVMSMRFGATDPELIYSYIDSSVTTECDSKEAASFSDAVDMLISGCVLMFIDGVDRCRAFSVQGYVKRNVTEPETETQLHGSREGFVDMYKDNVTLIRRRFKSPYLRFETITVGESSKTTVCVCYHEKRADKKTVDDVKRKLMNAKLDIVTGAGVVRPFLDGRGLSFFSAVGTTERPDVFVSRISEGRVGIIVDGTPFALTVPHLFIENFHTPDDYLSRPYYAFVIRTTRILCFLISVLLPGFYVAVGTYHQEIFPADIIYDIAASMQGTPFPLVVESLVIHFIYEIVREAGLRMPSSMGHAVSIVGALVIGEAAVKARLVSAPMLIVVALTAICTCVIFPLHQPVSVLKLIFIVAGGTMGLYGIMILFAFLVINLCSVNSFGVPYTAPFSPFDIYASRDGVTFAGWRKVGYRYMNIRRINGSADYDKN